MKSGYFDCDMCYQLGIHCNLFAAPDPERVCQSVVFLNGRYLLWLFRAEEKINVRKEIGLFRTDMLLKCSILCELFWLGAEMAERLILRPSWEPQSRPLLCSTRVKICARRTVKHCYWFTAEYLRREDRARTISTVILGKRALPTLLRVFFVVSISDMPSGCLLFQRTGLDLSPLAALCAFATAAWAAQAIVTLLRDLGATSGGQITHEAGQHQWDGCHERPASATVRVRARARLVGARAFVVLILSAVVENGLD